MKIVKDESKNMLNIFLHNDNKYIDINYGGNGDLYWTIHSIKDETDEDNYDEFIITKENYQIYSLFEQLFIDMKNINIFFLDIPFYIETEEEKQEYLRERQKENEEMKKRYRLFNKSNYNELFSEDGKTITWYSDSVAHDVANILKIKKCDDIFKIEFYVQPHIEGYDMDLHFKGCIPIRFRNSGSSYDPFNLLFMKMYNSLKEVDDVHEFGHQIHMEEYLYNKEHERKLKKC